MNKILVFLLFFTWLFIGIKSCSPKQNTFITVESGQTWIYVAFENNPYRATEIDTNYVLDVKNDYVLYITNKKDTTSRSVNYFKIGSKLIKK